jgi:hypothetical protein
MLVVSLLSNNLVLSRIMLSHLSCNSPLARIIKQCNSLDVLFLIATLDVLFLIATSFTTEKISFTIQFATQVHESRCKFDSLRFY